MEEEDQSEGEDLNQRLDQKCKELTEFRLRFDKLTKENQNLTKFNQDLRDQIKLLTGKLNLLQKLEASESVNACPTCKTNNRSEGQSKSLSWTQEAAAKRVKITDLVQEAAQETCGVQDYVYDNKTRTYRSKSTGWYYYGDSGLFYDPNSRNYYRYDEKTKSYNFYSSLDEQLTKKQDMNKLKKRTKKKERKKKEKKKKVKKLKLKKEEPKEDEEEEEDGEIGDEEEGELSSSNSSSSHSSSSDSSDSEQEFTVKLPPDMITIKQSEIKNDPKINPCIRLIVHESDGLELGSLLLITCFGAQIGSDKNCDLHIPDSSVDAVHARVSFDEDENCYWLRDLDSKAGTYVNDRLLDGVRMRIKHSDHIRVGRTKLLAHIHLEKDRTCDDCEPGCVQAILKQQQQQQQQSNTLSNINNGWTNASILSKKEKEDHRRKEMKQLNKQLQKKYGINQYMAEANIVSSSSNGEYQDRAGERRRTKGSDCPYEKTDLTVTSSNQPLPQTNVGMKLLMKSGWSGPKPNDPDYDCKLINVKANQERRGLGG